MENIDRVFVINLDKRNDRMEEFLRQCEKVNMDMSKLERFSAIYMPENPCVGCTLSHLEVIKIAKQRNYKNILVFEDDFDFLVSGEKLYKNLNNFFSLNLNFKVAMLAYYLPSSDKVRVNDLISYTRDASNASGYIANESCYDELIYWLSYGAENLKRTGEHWNYINDQIWKKLQGDKWFIFNERLGKQRPSFSDLGGNFRYPEN